MKGKGLFSPGSVASMGWWRLFLAGAAICLAAPVVELALGAPGGESAWTTGYGIAATALLVIALAYGLRRRMPRWGPVSLHHWVQAHVYGGTLFLVLLVVHSGADMPGGPLTWGLWVSSLWVVVTGLAGVVIQKWIPPALTSALTTEVHYDRIPELVAAVREKARELAAASGESVRNFYEANLAAALAGPRTSLIYFIDVTGGIQSHMRRVDYLSRLVDEDDAQRLEELRTLMRTKLEMDAHYTLQKALRWWLYLHVPGGLVLTVLVAIHVFAVLYLLNAMTVERSKRSFGDAGLPVATRYVHPSNRNRIIWIGAAIGALAGVLLVMNLEFGGGDLVANGELSSAHAVLDTRCAECHTPFQGVTTRTCSACHERSGDALGAYTFNAHYVYASRDRTRAFGRENEVTCAVCHREHRGRRADLLDTVSDDQCASCHQMDDFREDHPEFAFAAEAVPDDAGLTFPHIRHVELVLDDRDSDNVEAACLACHEPTADARLFLPIRFDTACGGCHLTFGEESAELPVQPARVPIVRAAGDGVALTLGVETLETVRARLGPGEQWAGRTSAAHFDVSDGIVVKTGIDHADPWVLHNLRRLRRVIYPSGGLADLLVASADVSPADKRELYGEALTTLRGHAEGLRGRDEEWVQTALLEIDQLAGALEGRVSDPNTTLNDTRFRLSARDPRLTDGQLDEIDRFAAEIAQPCAPCHAIDRATIRRVRQEQHVLRRARFDHGAHVIQRGCLDCHSRIPFTEYVGADEAIDPALDNAAIQNIPAIATCRQCHRPDAVSDRCLTCHEFHPDRGAHSRLLP